MDPGTILGVIALALKASAALYALIDATLAAPKEVLAVSNEAKAFATVLNALQALLNNGTIKEEVLLPLGVPLNNCLSTLTTLSAEIQPYSESCWLIRKRKWRCVTWAFKRAEVRELCLMLAHTKMTLDIAINIMNTIKLAQNSNQVCDGFEQLRVELKARDEAKAVPGSLSCRRGSDSHTDAGFALRRFLESESMADQFWNHSSGSLSAEWETSIVEDAMTSDSYLQTGEEREHFIPTSNPADG